MALSAAATITWLSPLTTSPRRIESQNRRFLMGVDYQRALLIAARMM
jgi:hypothetical protein